MKQLRKDEPYQSVSRCSRCHDEPPLEGQRYGRKCHALAAREYRERRKAKTEQLRRRLNALVCTTHRLRKEIQILREDGLTPPTP